jgi:hypothetical protein
MRAALERYFTRTMGAPRQRQIQRVQHQAGRPGGADGEAVVTRLDLAGFEDEFTRLEFVAADAGVADRRRGAHRHQMLRLQPRLGPVGAHIDEAEWLPSDEPKREAGAQHLPAALAERSIQLNHRGIIPAAKMCLAAVHDL